MIDPTTAAATTPLSPEETRLRQACAQMEGVFLAQLMKAMRETVPHDGVVDGGNGEDMFTAMLDEHVSAVASARQERGLGAALFRQLREAFLASEERLDPGESQQLDVAPGAAAVAARDAAATVVGGA
ncbi:MAG: rod-binding protein [Longimicrobiales bacterium]